MKSWSAAIGFGVLVWLVPFAIAFMIYPLHQAHRPLFESIMAVAVTGAASLLGLAYLRRHEHVMARDGLLVGLLWLIICIAIDAPLMLIGGPMKMSFSAYMADIGVTYLCIPIVMITLSIAVARGQRR